MFGGKYLVAPVLKLGAREREVYLPAGRWKDVDSGEILEGGKTVSVNAPIEEIPVFEKL
jgi:alpha-D-xyloside xylohydrolase